MKREEVLLRQGYRLLSDGVWGKPVGMSVLVYREDKQRILEYFKNSAGEVCIWSDDTLSSSEHFLKDLLEFEANGNYTLPTVGDVPEFGWLTSHDRIQLE